MENTISTCLRPLSPHRWQVNIREVFLPHPVLKTRAMFLNRSVRSRLRYGWHAWRSTHLEIFKLLSIYKSFLKSTIKNWLRWINRIYLQEDNPSADAIENLKRRYLPNKIKITWRIATVATAKMDSRYNYKGNNDIICYFFLHYQKQNVRKEIPNSIRET